MDFYLAVFTRSTRSERILFRHRSVNDGDVFCCGERYEGCRSGDELGEEAMGDIVRRLMERDDDEVLGAAW